MVMIRKPHHTRGFFQPLFQSDGAQQPSAKRTHAKSWRKTRAGWVLNHKRQASPAMAEQKSAARRSLDVRGNSRYLEYTELPVHKRENTQRRADHDHRHDG
jgi:hypothetical protein